MRPKPTCAKASGLKLVRSAELSVWEWCCRHPVDNFSRGDKVAAFRGGMGRTIKGSYGEMTLVPATNVAKIAMDLPWQEFAVISAS